MFIKLKKRELITFIVIGKLANPLSPCKLYDYYSFATHSANIKTTIKLAHTLHTNIGY